MKKLQITIAIFLGLFYSKGFSQEQRQEKIEATTSRQAKRELVFGFKAGFNNSNVYDAQGQNFVADSKSGFAGGGFVAIPLGSFIGIQPEILYSQKGFRSTGTIDNAPYSLERTSNYLDIPLQLQLKPFRFLSLLGGIQYSYLVSQQDRLSNGVNSIEQSQQFKNDNIRKNILGAVLGADINIRHFVISGRAGWDLRANRGDGSSFTPRYKNIWLQATIGFRFY